MVNYFVDGGKKIWRNNFNSEEINKISDLKCKNMKKTTLKAKMTGIINT